MGSEQEKELPRSKISPGFAARLEQLGPKEQVRAIVMLQANDERESLREHYAVGFSPAKKRQTAEERAASVKSVRRALAKALPHLDRVLKRYRGKRLRDEVDALGSVPVVTTAAGINALTSLDYVKAILEDQQVRSAF